jgi:hypothetical protein
MSKKHSGPPGETLYYLGWASMAIPRVPTHPATEAEAKSNPSYYVATYDEAGRLATFTKIFNGQTEWADEYSYWDNGKLRRRIMVRGDGSERLEDYDSRGKLIG